MDLLVDGSSDFTGGQDASKVPDRIAANCYASGVNLSTKQGVIQPRWGFERQSIKFPDGFIVNQYQRQIPYREVFESGKFQMCAPYYVSGVTQVIIIVVSGIIFSYNPASSSLNVIDIVGGSQLNARAQRLNWTAAGKYLVIYDFPDYPVIIDGLQASRADPTLMEVPASTQGAFNQNRLYVANASNEFTGGDPVGSLAAPLAPITFKEVQTVGSPYYGQIFQLPTSDHNDPITFMGFLPVSDTSTGIGPLVVATNRAIYSYNTQNPRSSWEAGGFGTIVNYNAGVVGPRAWASVNSDAFFLSSDGFIRSFSMSREEQHKWARVPISREVENWFTTFDKSLISLSFVSYFKNKIFFSVNPYRMAVEDFKNGGAISDYAHGGMVVMELDNISAMGQAGNPIWAGLWTGINPMDTVNLGEEAFVLSKDLTSVNRIYAINPNITYDTADNVIRQVRSRVYTKQYVFQDPFLNKELHSIDFNISNIEGDFSVDVKYQPEHAPYMLPWKNYTHLAPWRTCGIPETCLINGFASHDIRDFSFGAPADSACNPVTKDLYRVFRKLQVSVTITGKYWEIRECRIKAMAKTPNLLQNLCEVLPAVPICAACNDDWAVEPFESCEKLST